MISPAFPRRLLFLLLMMVCGLAPAWSADVRALYQQGQYVAAAQDGLATLLREPWNHELRFLVADSLERSGDVAAAQSQFQALLGTILTEPAQMRLNNLLTATGKPAKQVQLASASSNFQVFELPARPLARPVSSVEEAAPPRSKLALREQIKLPARAPELEAVFQLSAEGDYRAAARQGKRLMDRGMVDDDLRLLVANSLAWTGQSEEAIAAYKKIIETSGSAAKVNDARAGLANSLRWQGRDDLALPLYRQALASDSGHEASKEGVVYAERELRPKTTISYGQSNDSSEMHRRTLGINHRWRDPGLRHGFEVEAFGNNDTLPTDRALQRELTFRYQPLNIPLKPRFWVSAQTLPKTGTFGGVQLQLVPNKLSFELDQMNWGARALNPRAELRGLTAMHVGLASRVTSAFGDLNAAIDYYDISDNNNILTNSLRYTAPWRVLGFKAFVGAENREPKFNSLDYWSPALGYGATYAGLQGDWSAERWELFMSGQKGRRLYGDAGDSWSLSGGGRLWITQQLALGLRLWGMSSVRDSAAYRANAGTVTVESLW